MWALYCLSYAHISFFVVVETVCITLESIKPFFREKKEEGKEVREREKKKKEQREKTGRREGERREEEKEEGKRRKEEERKEGEREKVHLGI
jgi:hypothetical protein